MRLPNTAGPFDLRQIRGPGAQILGADESAPAELARDKPFGTNFFAKFGKANAGSLGSFVDTVEDPIAH
jgi:hypothetical protein